MIGKTSCCNTTKWLPGHAFVCEYRGLNRRRRHSIVSRESSLAITERHLTTTSSAPSPYLVCLCCRSDARRRQRELDEEDRRPQLTASSVLETEPFRRAEWDNRHRSSRRRRHHGDGGSPTGCSNNEVEQYFDYLGGGSTSVGSNSNGKSNRGESGESSNGKRSVIRHLMISCDTGLSFKFERDTLRQTACYFDGEEEEKQVGVTNLQLRRGRK